MPIARIGKRPKKLKCKPGFEQRGAACQKITNKNGIQGWSTRKKVGAAVGAYVAASVAFAASWRAGAVLRERNIQAKGYNEINGEKAHPNLSKNLRAFEDSVKDNKFETLAFLDSKGNTLLKKPGEQFQVTINPLEAAKIIKASNQNKGVILTHNHPKIGGDYAASFSMQDVLCAGALKAKQLRAVSGEEVFIMNPPKGQNFSLELSKKVQASYNQRSFEKNVEYSTKMLFGMDLSEANMRATHETWEAVAKDIPEINYQKLTRGNARYIKGYSK